MTRDDPDLPHYELACDVAAHGTRVGDIPRLEREKADLRAVAAELRAGAEDLYKRGQPWTVPLVAAIVADYEASVRGSVAKRVRRREGVGLER